MFHVFQMTSYHTQIGYRQWKLRYNYYALQQSSFISTISRSCIVLVRLCAHSNGCHKECCIGIPWTQIYITPNVVALKIPSGVNIRQSRLWQCQKGIYSHVYKMSVERLVCACVCRLVSYTCTIKEAGCWKRRHRKKKAGRMGMRKIKTRTQTEKDKDRE